MLFPLLPLLQVAAIGSALPAHLPARTYNGRDGETTVQPPRIEATVTVDGVLDEPVWSTAARLTGFSQYSPVDGRPANDSTEVLVWYSHDAIYFGIRAFEHHGPVHATLADRDNIAADDYVQIILDTFDSHRQAYVFGVNPFGVQADGILSEGTQSHGTSIGAAANVRDTVDYSTDYTYESRGHLTDWGYEVEVRIPFKSIRFQSAHEQKWALQIIRQVQHSNYQDTWAPALRASASFLRQSGALAGLTGISRGHVVDFNPELTSHVDGTPTGTGWGYNTGRPELGGNVRYALTDNLTADGTVKPDFSQVEADVPQLVYDPRNALYYPEKRPFFLDGLELFDTPNNLIYTRSILQPTGAVKLTGKFANMDVGFLSAVDAASASASGDVHPVFNLLRLHRQAGAVTLGGIVADREEGGDYNRVFGADARILFGGIYSLRLQGVAASTRADTARHVAPLWDVLFDRSGHRFRMHYQITGIDPDFVDRSGFISRPGIVNSNIDQSITTYGRPGSLIESWIADFSAVDTWDYDPFLRGRAAADIRWHLSNQLNLRGGWALVGNVFVETYGYDPTLYANYYIAQPTPTGVDTVHYKGTLRLPNLDIVTALNTPRWSQFDASVQTITGYDENFYEWASADIVFVTATVNWRPSDRARVGLIYEQQKYIRRTDHSVVGERRVPRLKLEYQVSRPIFIRIIGQYDAEFQDSLRDDSRTNAPILMRDPLTGAYTRAGRSTSNTVSANWLFAYTPTPGTVVYLGYGNTLVEPDAFALRGLRRIQDGWFAKVSYLFRLGS